MKAAGSNGAALEIEEILMIPGRPVCALREGFAPFDSD